MTNKFYQILGLFLLGFLFFPTSVAAAEPELRLSFPDGVISVPGQKFSASFADSSDGLGAESLEFRYAWYQDQPWSDWTRQRLATHIYSLVGDKRFRLEARNSLGQIVSTSARLRVVDQQLPYGYFDVSPKQGITSTPFKFTPRVWDSLASSRDSFDIRWDFDGDGAWDTSWETPRVREHIYDQIGSYAPKLEIRDRVGGIRYLPSYRHSAGGVAYLQVRSDLRPKPFFSVRSYDGEVGTLYYFDATQSLPYSYTLYQPTQRQNPGTYYFKWDFDGDGEYETDWSPDPTARRRFLIGDQSYTTVLKVKNQYGEQRFSKTFYVKKSSAPSASFLIRPIQGGSNRDYELDARASQNSNGVGALRYAWDFGADGLIDTDFSRKNETYLYTFKHTGTRQIRLLVKNSEGKISETTHSVIVYEDSFVPSFSISPRIGKPDDTVFTWNASALDRRGEEFSYAWDWDDDGELDVQWSSSSIQKHIFLSSGRKQIRLWIRDRYGRVMKSEARTIIVSDDGLTRSYLPVARASSHWSETYVDYLRAGDFTSARTISEYRPDAYLSRAELLQLLYAGLGQRVPTDLSTIDYTDVQSSDWFAPAVSYATQQGWITLKLEFYPAWNVRLIEAIKIILEAYDIDQTLATERRFADIPTASWAEPYASRAATIGMVESFPDGNFNPNRNITRGEVAKLIYKAQHYNLK